MFAGKILSIPLVALGAAGFNADMEPSIPRLQSHISPHPRTVSIPTFRPTTSAIVVPNISVLHPTFYPHSNYLRPNIPVMTHEYSCFHKLAKPTWICIISYTFFVLNKFAGHAHPWGRGSRQLMLNKSPSQEKRSRPKPKPAYSSSNKKLRCPINGIPQEPRQKISACPLEMQQQVVQPAQAMVVRSAS